MVIPIKGEVLRAGVSKKGDKYVSLLIDRPDGGRDTLLVFKVKKDYKPREEYEGAINAFITMASEV